GARNPGVLTDAYRLQKLNRAAAENMRETGVKYADALRNVGADQGAIDVLVDARNHGIIGTGKTSDVFRVNDSLLPGTQKSFGRRLANPFSQDNPALQSGRAVGQAIENNARLGLFIDGKAHKGMNSKHAAERVRTYLFDYGDLTSFESEQIRMLSRFYTFTRKNTALQARIMMTQPGNIHNAERITEEFTNQ
ncbi:MAG: hypothetical protein GY941_03475, partial [Planctomycetes bacterium]|nr:hypothetical protein [Planctomycetota bacterium]